MATAGGIIENPITTDRIIFRKTRQDTNGQLLQFDNYHQVSGIGPVEHLHPLQEETFEVIAGTFAIRQNGREQIVRVGERVVVPPGTRHTWRNAGNDELHLLTEFRPALHFEEIIETVCALAQARRMSQDGMPDLRQMAVTLHEYPGEFFLVGPPIWGQRILYRVLGTVMKRLFGYNALYPYKIAAV